ncbi:MAG: flagellar protein FlaG [Rhodocyclaceae bacterium]|nr:flagellar protein FlaG [Rhodocyclaceae bacterium]
MAIDQIGGSPPALTPALQPASSPPIQAASPVSGTSPLAPVAPVKEPTAEQLNHAMQEVQKAVAPVAQELQFSIDKDTGRTVVKVMDTETHKVVRQIPSEEVMAMAQQLDKLQGLLMKDKA